MTNWPGGNFSQPYDSSNIKIQNIFNNAELDENTLDRKTGLPGMGKPITRTYTGLQSKACSIRTIGDVTVDFFLH